MGYLVGLIDFKVYSDSAQTEYPKELIPHIEKEFSASTASEVLVASVSLAASGSQTVNFNGLDSCKYFYLYSDTSNLTLTPNGSATTFTYTAQVPGFVPIQLTSLVIENASASNATTVTLVLIKG